MRSVCLCRLSARLHRKHFDVVLRIRVSELQGSSQCIHKALMLRFHLAIDLADVVLVRMTIRDIAFHETHHLSPPRQCLKTGARQAFPAVTEFELILSRKRPHYDDTG